MQSVALTAFTIIMTVALYFISRQIYFKLKISLLTPVIISSTIIIIILHYLGIPFEQYRPGKDIMLFLFGPATVALGLPLYQNRQALREAFVPILVSIGSGAIVIFTSAVWLAKLSGLDPLLVTTISLKSITAPIAIEIAHVIGGDPAITVAFAIFTGTFGSMIGPKFLSLCKINSPVARGLAMGVAVSGQGTATILQEGATQGAMAGVAVGLSGIIIAFIAPFYLPWILKFL